MSKSVIGLDLGRHSVKAWEIQKKLGKSWELLNVYEEPLPDSLRFEPAEGEEGEESPDSTLSDFLKRFLETNGLLGKTVLAGLPADKAFLHVLRFPQTNLKVIGQIYRAEVEDLLPFPIEDAVLDFQVLSKGEDGTVILAAAALKREVKRSLEILEGAGLAVSRLGLESCALANLGRLYSKRWADKRIALLDIGARKSVLAIFNQGSLQQVRVLPAGGREIDLDAAELLGKEPQAAELIKETRGDICPPGEDRGLEELKISEAISKTMDTLIGEFNRTLRKAESQWGAELDELLLMGGVARCGGVEAYFEQKTGRPARRLELSEGIESKTNGSSLPQSISAAGLGLAADPGGAGSVDLRKEEFALRSAVEGVERRLIGLGAMLLVSLLIWGGLGYARSMMQERRADALEEDIALIYSDAIGEKAPWGKELMLLKQSVESLQAVRPDADSLELSAIEAMRRVSEAIGDSFSVEFERFEFNFSRHEMKIRGETNTFEAVSGIEKSLEAKPEFENNVEITKSETGTDGVKFSMIVNY